MNVVIVNESVPYPPTAGNRIRTLNLMVRLARRHRVTYLCRAGEDEAETRAAEEHLRERGIRMIVGAPAPVRKAGAAFYARLGANVFEASPYAITSHNSPELRARIVELAWSEQVDLWQFEWMAYADALQGIASARTLVVAHNVESLIWQRYLENEKRPLHRAYLQMQWRKFVRCERRIFSGADGVICVSEQDAALARRDFGARRTWVVDNGIDRAWFEQAKAPRELGTILFLGSLDWRPNQEAVRLLLNDIMPRIWQQEPSARLRIVGRKAPPWLCEKVRQAKRVELHADVADVRPYLASSEVMTVPLKVGGGSRLKILEALACGLPVVSTSVGYEGLELTDGRELVVADGQEAMARELLRVLRDAELARSLGAAGRRLVYARYDWDFLAAKQELVWQQIVLRKPIESLAISVAKAASVQGNGSEAAI